MTTIEKWYLESVLIVKDGRSKDRFQQLTNLVIKRNKHYHRKVAFKNYLIKDFKNIIIGDIDYLYQVIQKSKLYRFNKFDNEFKKDLAKVFGYDNFKLKLGKELTLKLGIKVCPYCLSQYTLIDTKRDRHIFEYDHFLPQTKYPFLSISLHNMIPSCGNCNRIKKDKEGLVPIEYHPLGQNTFHDLYEFKISDKSLVDYYINGITNFEVEARTIEPNDARSMQLYKYLNTFAITGLMNRHSDIIHELLIKLEYYSDSKKRELSAIGGAHSFTIHDIERLLTGYYTLRDDYDKRPLSKFTTDIARQIGLI